ncbi:MAG TPA: DUF3306 domain-containing protein [Methylibium sp.]|uniref:DUF3306 domain-containing protein n=1 Tax=Methylibium sp. TaxID=2067992 RepID=UPI002DB7A931|nr:DUF3306 domain-containing protein [Methylibium sp.]HEU4459851.1 DUF3306 domain-containing protein [Methylibium sp.]
MSDRPDGFLARWSRRKADMKAGREALPERLAPAVAPAPPVHAELVEAPPAAAPAQAGPEAPPSPPAPTLDDVAALGKDSDYTRFVAPDVDAKVKNAAVKKLFASDPHFNVMDGLDIYIDDYNKSEPLPRSMLRQLASARALGLLDDELEEQPKPESTTSHEPDADLQLQPDDAAGRGGAGQLDDPPDPVPPRGA